MNAPEVNRWRRLTEASFDGEYGTLVALLNAVLGPDGWNVEGLEFVDLGVGVAQVALVIGQTSRVGIGIGQATGPERYQQGYQRALVNAARQFGIGGGQGQGQPAGPGPRTEPPAQASGGESHPWATQRPGGAGERREPTPMRPGERQAAPASGERPVLPVTEAQLKAIFAIGRGAARMNEADVTAFAVELYGLRPSELDRRQASAFIDELKKLREEQ